MKTLTEFTGFQLGDSVKILEQTTAQLTQEGKTPEEISTALGQAFKMEGDKLKFFLNALEFAKQTPKNLKRILVMQFDEKDKKPDSAKEKDGHYYVTEFFFVPQPKKFDRFGKGGGKFKGKGRKGGRGGRDGRDNKGRDGRRPPRAPGEQPMQHAGGRPGPQDGKGKEGGDQSPRPPRRKFFKPKREGAPKGAPSGGAPKGSSHKPADGQLGSAPTTAGISLATDKETTTETKSS